MIFQVQITALPLFSLAAAYWAYTRRRDGLAGVILSLALVKPELALIPWAVFMGIAAYHRRWRLPVFFMITQVVLFLLSLAAAGWWLPGWIAALGRYSIYAQSTWGINTAWQIHPLFAVLILLVAGWMIYPLRHNLTAFFAASIPAGLLLLPHTPFWNLTLLLIPLSLAWRAKGRWVVGLTWLLGWALFPYPTTWQVQYLIFPMLALLALALANQEQVSARLLKKGNIPARIGYIAFLRQIAPPPAPFARVGF